MKKLKVFVDEYPVLILLAILVFAVGLRIHYTSQKEGFHVDEILSLQFIHTTNYFRDGTFDSENRDKWTKGKTFIDYYFTLDRSNSNKDIRTLLRDTKDPPHPNMYYVFLRTALYNGIRGVDGLYKYYGVGLNLLFFCVGVLFLYHLFNNIYENRSHALLVVFLYSISTGAISTTLFIRMYELLSLGIIVTCFFTFRIFIKKKAGLLDFILLYFVTSIGYLSHYYYTIFVFVLMILVIFHYIKWKQYNFILYFGITFIQGFITSQVLYPQFVKGFFPTSYRAEEAYSKLDLGFLIDQITSKVWIMGKIINNNIVYCFPLFIICAVLLIVFSLYKKKKIFVKKEESYLILLALILSFIFIYLSPYTAPRYISGLFPILVSIIVLVLRMITITKIRYGLTAIICLFYIICSFNISNIRHLHRDEINKLLFRENTNIPVYFLSTTDWMRSNLMPYFMEKQHYKLMTDKKTVLDFEETGKNELYLVMENDARVNRMKEQVVADGWTIENEVSYYEYIIAKIVKSQV